jgi:hypothetical protein
VLSDTAASFLLFEKNNVAEFSYGKDSWPMGEGANFEITVPANTALEIQNGWNGSVKVERVTGDVEVKGLNCEVKLTDLGGGAIVETMNGEITASFAALPDKKPVSFSSMNGEVKLRVPADARANVRFRTHNGAILTDFADDVLKTKSEDLGRTDWGTVAGQHIAMAAQIGSQVGREVAQMAREAASDVKSAVHEAQAEARDRAEEAKDRAADLAEKSTGEVPPHPSRPPSASCPAPAAPAQHSGHRRRQGRERHAQRRRYRDSGDHDEWRHHAAEAAVTATEKRRAGGGVKRGLLAVTPLHGSAEL